MIVQEVTNDIISSGGFKEQGFKLKNPAFIFEILSSKIYTDKIGAIIREIISNAVDANIEVKSKKKIDLHLPTESEKWLSIRDYGPGMNSERIKVFVSFGDSTKRESNEQIGYFGMGSKSPFAYTDSFYITTYVKGYKCEYMAYINENRERMLMTLNKTISDECSGTEVKIHMKEERDRNLFHSSFFSIWGYSLNLFNINIKPINPYYIHPVQDLHTRKDITFGCIPSHNDEITIMNGNIAYNLSHSDISNLSKYVSNSELDRHFRMFQSWNMRLHFKIGELKLAVNRESLEICEENAIALTSKVIGIRSEIIGAFSKKLESKEFLRVKYALKRYNMLPTQMQFTYHTSDAKFYKIYGDKLDGVRSGSFNVYLDGQVLYYMEGQLNKIKDRILKFLKSNNMESCRVICFESEKEIEKFKLRFPIVPFIPLHTIIPDTKPREVKPRIDVFKSAISGKRITRYGTDLNMLEFEKSLNEVCYYIPTAFGKSVTSSPLGSDIRNIIINQPERSFELMFKDTTPIYRIAASVKSIIPKHWIDFETVLKNKIENIDLDKDTLYYIIYNHYSKYIYGKSFVQSDLQEQLLTKIIGGVPHSHSWYNANYGYGYDRIIECIQKNTKTRNLIAKHIRDIKKHTLHIIANFSDIFINVYTHNVILNNRIKTAEAAVAAYINQI